MTLATLLNKNILEFFNLLSSDKEVSKRNYNDLHNGRIRSGVKYDFKRKCLRIKAGIMLCYAGL